MKVLLVNTNRMKPVVAPIGLDYLGDSLRAAGHECALADLCFSENAQQDLDAAAASFAPDLVGITVRNIDDCYFASGEFFLPAVRGLVAGLREATDAPIVLGGVGFSVMPEAVVEYCGADYGICGEGELGLVRLLDAVKGDGEMDSVPGLLWWDESGPCRNRAADVALEKLPPRSRSLVDNRRYFLEGGQAGFETKRGCPMQCIYCADPVARGKRSRLLPPRMVVEEMRALLAQGIDVLHACDCEMNIPLAHARDVCRGIIDAGLADKVRWYAYCSPAPFDEETARLMRRAGCAGIDFGADSGSPEMLRRLGRHFTTTDLEATAGHCRAAGIPFMYDLLIGGPGETPDTLRESIECIRRIEPDRVGLSVGVRVYDGTALAAQVRASGPLEKNPDLRGARLDNADFLRPVFYMSRALGDGIPARVADLVGGDPRFFLPGDPDSGKDYNYNDNELLVRAIRDGARGAYWDILRRMRAG